MSGLAPPAEPPPGPEDSSSRKREMETYYMRSVRIHSACGRLRFWRFVLREGCLRGQQQKGTKIATRLGIVGRARSFVGCCVYFLCLFRIGPRACCFSANRELQYLWSRINIICYQGLICPHNMWSRINTCSPEIVEVGTCNSRWNSRSSNS